MRVSSMQVFNIANNSFAKINTALIKSSEQLSTGQLVNRPSDDPIAATKILQASSIIDDIEQYRDNITFAKNNLKLEESMLNSADNIVVRIREIAVQAGNTATLSPAQYQALATEVDSRLDELMNLMNSQDVNGDYIFGGYKGKTPPFRGNALSGFEYLGDDGQHVIKIAHTTYVPVSDSGKSLFVDIDSAEPTIQTSVSPANQSSPPIRVSVGNIENDKIFNAFFPQDIVVSFNPDSDISPPGKNFTASNKLTGEVLIANQRYSSGASIELEGISFNITGSPYSGEPAKPASLLFGQGASINLPQDFSGANQARFNLSVNGETETFVVDRAINTLSDLVSTLNTSNNGNLEKLRQLGLSVDESGFSMADGVNITVSGGTAELDAVFGMDTRSGTTSVNGVLAKAGDHVFIDASIKQDLPTIFARFSQVMKNYDGSPEKRETLSQVVSTTLNNLDNAQDSVLQVITQIGARINTLESVDSLHLDSKLITEEMLKEIQGADFAEISTRLTEQTTILQAAQTVFVRVSQLNLFNQL